MSFYGKIREDMTKSQFQFDRIYANRFSMDAAIGKPQNQEGVTDGVFVGRFVLVDYNLNPRDGNPGSELGEHAESVGNGYHTLVKPGTSEYFWVEDYEDLPSDGFAIVTTIEELGDDNTPYLVYYYYKNESKYMGEEVTVDESKNIKKHKALFTQQRFAKFFENDEAQGEEAESLIVESNAQVDRDYYKNTYDGTVWQKIINSNKEDYILVAKLNSKMPELTTHIIGPEEPPKLTASTLTKYFLELPNSWKVNSKVIINTNEPTVNAKQRITTEQADQLGEDSVSIEKTRVDKISYDYKTIDGRDRTGEDLPKDVLNFSFSFPGFKKVLNHFWDLIYGGNGNEPTRKTNLNFYGKTVHVSGKHETNDYTTKDVDDMTEEDWAAVEKQFDPTTVAGLINLIQLYLGKGAIPVGASSENLANIGTEEERQNQLRVWYENNYIIPETAIPSSDGTDNADFFGLKYVIKKSIFKRIDSDGSGFEFSDDKKKILTVPTDKSVFRKLNEKDYERVELNDNDPYEDTLYYLDGYEYSLKNILAGDSILEILAQLYKKFNIDDPQSRDLNTVMGLFNELDDKVKNLSKQLRKDITWNAQNPQDQAIMKNVFGNDAVNEKSLLEYPYFSLDEVVSELGDIYQSHVKSHLIKTIESEDNEMSARLVFGTRKAGDAETLGLTEPQGIVYDGSIYKTSALRFLDNNVSYGKTQLKTKDDLLNTDTTGNYYIKDENDEFILVDSFTFQAQQAPNTEAADNIMVLVNSEQEMEDDLNYDYYFLGAEEDLWIGNPANNPGNGLSIGSGGLTIVGAGESQTLYEKYVVNNHLDTKNVVYPNSEELILTSDDEIRFYAGLNQYRNDWDQYNKYESLAGRKIVESIRAYLTIDSKLEAARYQLSQWQAQASKYNNALQQHILFRGYSKTEKSFSDYWQNVINNINDKFDVSVVEGGQTYSLWDINDSNIQNGKLPYTVHFERVATTENGLDNDFYYYKKDSNETWARLIGEISNTESTEAGPDGDYYYKYIRKLPKTPTFPVVKLINGEVRVINPSEFSSNSNTPPKISDYMTGLTTEDTDLYFTKVNGIPTKFLAFTRNEETNLFTPQSPGIADSIINDDLDTEQGRTYLRGFLRYQGEYSWSQTGEYYVLNDSINVAEKIKADKDVGNYGGENKYGYSEENGYYVLEYSVVNSQEDFFPLVANKEDVTFKRGIFIGQFGGENSLYRVLLTENDFDAANNVRRINWTSRTPDIEDYRVLTLSQNGLKFSSLQIGENNILTEDSNGALTINNNTVYDSSRITWGSSEPEESKGKIGDLYIQLME